MHEFIIWSGLPEHPHVASFLGVTAVGSPDHFVMVSPWQENGVISTYLEKTDASMFLPRANLLVCIWPSRSHCHYL